jgi:hypothetical protein
LLIPCSKELVGSNPTPRAIFGDSCDKLFSYAGWLSSISGVTLDQMLTVDYSTELEKKINDVTKYNSKAYFKAALKKVSLVNPENAEIICDYIVAEQTRMNIKESTKEGKMKGRSSYAYYC